MSRILTCELRFDGAELPALAAALGALWVADDGAAPDAYLHRLLAEPGREDPLSLAFEPDDWLRAFRREHPDMPTAPGKIAVGAFWAALREDAGQRVLSLTGATGSVSDALVESPAVRAALRVLADAVYGELCLVDEWQDIRPL